MSADTILVTGASGDLARRVIEILLENGARNIIATTRKPVRIVYLQEQEVTLRTGNFDDSIDDLTKAFSGATRMVLISATDFKKRLGQHKKAIDAAKKAGIQHIIYTSIQNADNTPAAGADSHLETEKYLATSGLKYTILRNSLYMEGLLMKLAGAIPIGSLGGNAGQGKFSFVSREDCARAAAGAAVLPLDRVENKYFDITGPRALGYEDLAKILSTIIGKSIPHYDFNMGFEEFRMTVMSWGLPEDAANAIASFDYAAKSGALGNVSHHVSELSGKPSQDLEDFLLEYRTMFLSQL